MTYPEFLVWLAQTPREWTLEAGQIRRRHDECPVSALDGLRACHWRRASHHLDDENTAQEMTHAADAAPDHDVAIRADLLRACGLTEARHG